jgi:hypothetical protein
MGTMDTADVNPSGPTAVDRGEDWQRFERARIIERRRFEERAMRAEALPSDLGRGAA